jgi:hypothetical protein
MKQHILSHISEQHIFDEDFQHFLKEKPLIMSLKIGCLLMTPSRNNFSVIAH